MRPRQQQHHAGSRGVPQQQHRGRRSPCCPPAAEQAWEPVCGTIGRRWLEQLLVRAAGAARAAVLPLPSAGSIAVDTLVRIEGRVFTRPCCGTSHRSCCHSSCSCSTGTTPGTHKASRARFFCDQATASKALVLQHRHDSNPQLQTERCARASRGCSGSGMQPPGSFRDAVSCCRWPRFDAAPAGNSPAHCRASATAPPPPPAAAPPGRFHRSWSAPPCPRIRWGGRR